jgi:hypothetical protein
MCYVICFTAQVEKVTTGREVSVVDAVLAKNTFVG